MKNLLLNQLKQFIRSGQLRFVEAENLIAKNFIY